MSKQMYCASLLAPPIRDQSGLGDDDMVGMENHPGNRYPSLIKPGTGKSLQMEIFMGKFSNGGVSIAMFDS